MEMRNFDATNIPPQQAGGKHPEYSGPATITGTRAEPTKDGTGGMFVVTYTTPAGSIDSRYNLWNKSEKAVEIANKELSALCHATGIFKLSMSADNLPMCGHELRGAQLVIDVRPQANNPDYMEVKKVYDRNGNEPGKAPTNAPQPQQQGSAWGGGNGQAAPQPAANPNPAPAAATSGWGNTQGTVAANPTQGGGGAPPWVK